MLSIEEVDFNELRLAKSGRTVKLLYGVEKKPLQIKTPKLYSPFGLKVFNNSYSQFNDCSIDCSIQTTGQDKVSELHAKFNALTARIKELINEQLSLFGVKDPITDIQLGEIFRENGAYPKLMKINCPRDKNGNFDFVIFDENKEKIRITDSNIESILTKGKTFVAILECNKIWYYKEKFGISWNIIQGRFNKKKEKEAEKDTNSDQMNENDSGNIYMQKLLIEDD
jgi:predicted transcriptional regulator